MPSSNSCSTSNRDYDSKWVLALYTEYRAQTQGVRQTASFNRSIKVGVAFFDNTSLQFHIGQLDDDASHSKLKALLI